MTGSESTRLIASFLSGNASKEEKRLFAEWLSQSPANEVLFQELEKIWSNSSITRDLANPETDAEWNKLAERIESDKNTPRPVYFIRHHWLKVAASLVILLVAFWMLNRNDNTHADDSATVFASNDNVSFFYLPDSSEVLLAAHSTLTFEKTFGREIREVHLKGEGQFEVEHDSLHPFYVMMDEVVVRVVGTSFTVKEDSEVTVTVSTGKVKVYSRESPEHFILVERGEQAYIKNQKFAIPIKIKTDTAYSAETTSEEDKTEELQPERSMGSNRNSVSKEEEPSSKTPADNIAAEATDKANVLENEVSNPKTYLSVKSNWQKNQFNQSVIDGTIFNNAELTSYKNVDLRITYTKANGKTAITYITVYETIRPGQQLNFHKNLVDMFIHTKNLKIEVDKVEVEYPSR
ncbi:MAG TPA: FecR domain-containing protein [Cyclobacteriaceae bacterium]|nr:FecR domain-containing protein [Cyclobacteriaceae bacterium]